MVSNTIEKEIEIAPGILYNVSQAGKYKVACLYGGIEIGFWNSPKTEKK